MKTAPKSIPSLLVVGTAAASLLAPAFSGAQTIATQASRLSASWRQIRAADFTVIGNAFEGDLRRTYTSIHAFRAAVSNLFPDSRMAAPVPTSIVVFRDFSAFSRFQPRDSNGRRQNVAGYAAFDADRNTIVFGSAGRPDSYPIVFHEYAHYLVHLNARAQLPMWLNEGLAEFYSTFEPDYKGRSLLGRPPTERLRELRTFSWIPLREVVSPRDMEKLWRSNERINMFYAEAWALVHYLIVVREGPVRSPFDAYLKALTRASSQDVAFVQAFGVNVDVMDRELQQYVRRFIFKAFSVPKSERSVEPTKVERVSEADVHQIQGRLLAGVASIDQAEKELQAALELDPTNADSRISMASLRIDQDRPDEAIALLGQVAQTMPDYVPALYYLGTARLSEWQAEGALTAFERATKVNANHTYAWLGLSAAALMMNRDSQSRAALSQAMALEANPAHYYAHARTALRIGRNDVAAAAAHSYIDRVGLAESSAQYTAFLAAIAHWREGRPLEADAILATAQTAIAPDTWTALVLQFLQGHLDAEHLLAKAKTNGERTEAHTYVGFKQDLAGRHEEALAHFRWVADQGAKNYTEYTLARNELARLRHAAVEK